MIRPFLHPISLGFSCLVFILLTSCNSKEDCPPNQLLGRLSLSQESKPFLPFENIHYLVYIDSAAIDTAFLINPKALVFDSSWTVVENICVEDEVRADRYYLSEHRTADYLDSDTARKFRIIGNLNINEDFLSKNSTPANPVLYDELKLTVHRTNPSISSGVATTEFVASDRGNAANFSDSLKARVQRFALLPQVKIQDSVYQDVYEFKYRDTAVFYFKSGKGVVAFRDINSKWWNLHKAF
ncbi:MAG: hypothetical protein JNL65_00385 [Saprospiraceae bacterium]|nr:hypothetical protein [Saprospiraceae bacterium]HRG67688.1 hypothetical protein [Saprospiraceae bacterium]